ncbi:MAG: alkylglycerol monooxygenase [Paraglaciecola sp.]|jgi:alkylglycerol monooxygenase
MSYIIYAIPFFFLLIGFELIAEKIKKTDYYRVNDAINSLTAGVLSRMIDIIKALVPFTVYVMLYDNFALFTFPQVVWVWIGVFIVYDFCYYWNHRLGHEMSLLWAAHVVHHSSEEYNLTTALRQSSSSLLSWIFYLPLALLGVDPLLLLSVGSLNLIYQFWVHTRHIPKLGWFEWVFVSPSNHRAHHGQNQIYIDRNYGGVFIIWDRLFGSFQEELANEPPIYGIRKALHSWNPLYANVHVYQQLLKDSWRTKRWRDKLRVWFGRTGWRPPDVERDYPLGRVDLTQFKKFDIALSAKCKLYLVVQYILTTGIGLAFLLNLASLDFQQQIMIIAVVFYASFSVGGMMENRAYGLWLEWGKHGAALLVVAFFGLSTWLSAVLVITALLSMAMLVWLKPEFDLIKDKEQQIAQPN